MKNCPYCSSVLNDNAVQCHVCGYVYQQQSSVPIAGQPFNSQGYQGNIIYPQNNMRILSNLRKYEKHKEMQCLECGYKGLVGIVGYKNSLGKRICLYISGFLSFVIISYLSNFAAAFVGGVSASGAVSCKGTFYILGLFCAISLFIKAEKKIYQCPNCEKHIEAR